MGVTETTVRAVNGRPAVSPLFHEDVIEEPATKQ